MEEKNVTKISLSTFLLIIAIIAIVIMGVFIYKLNNDKTIETKRATELQSQVNILNGTVNDLQGKINNISETINSSTSKNNTNLSNETTNTNNSSTNSSESSNTQVKKKNYDSYVGTWYNSTTQNEITIKSVTNNSITFTWFLYRLTGIDDDTTINFSNGEAIFYFEGYDDKNFDSKNTEDEKYIRKATIKLDENGVNVNVEDVKSLDNNYLVLDEPSLVYITKGLYSHPEKR